MRLFAFAILTGLAVGFLARGRLRNLAGLPVPLRLLPLAWAGLAVQIFAGFLPREAGGLDVRLAAILLSYALVATFIGGWSIMLRRHEVQGSLLFAMLIVGCGWLLNVVVIALNQGMPVSAEALEVSGRDPATDVTSGAFFKHVPLAPDTHFSFLGDVIPTFPGGPVVSAGDVVLAVGTALFIALSMRLSKRAQAGARVIGFRAES